ncbi:MAG: hypothetical protein ACKVTZ_04810 [Bacteroidia bacterium]
MATRWTLAMLNTGWEIFKQNIGGFIGYLIVMFILLGLSVITVIGTLVVAAPLMMGFYLVADKIYKGQQHSFGDFFGGFSHTVQLLIAYLLMMLAASLLTLPLTGSFVLAFKSIAESGELDGMTDSGEMISTLLPLMGGSIGLGLLLFVPLIYVMISLSLTPFLIVFEGFPAVEAMKMSWKLVRKQWLMIFAGYLLAGIIGQLGSIAFGIGVLFTMPLSYCMHYALYRQVVPASDTLDDKINEIGTDVNKAW